MNVSLVPLVPLIPLAPPAPGGAARPASGGPEPQVPVSLFGPLLLALLGLGDASEPERGSEAAGQALTSPDPAQAAAEPEATPGEGMTGRASDAAALPPTGSEHARPTRAGWAALAGSARPPQLQETGAASPLATRGSEGSRSAAPPAEEAEEKATEGRLPGVEPDAAAGPRAQSGPSGPSLVTAAPPGSAPPPAAVTGPQPPPATDVRTANRDLSRLAPELRSRVERVIERMEAEHGVRVTLAEGFRTSERQSFLYGQGRTRPGSVVTWTRDSRHTVGRAADLRVEGPWEQPSVYALLQTIASQEGLSTLGMKDPGHVELKDGTDQAGGRPPMQQVAGDAPDGSWAVVERDAGAAVGPTAEVARVAHVARVAQVTSPASVAQVTGPTRAGRRPSDSAAEAAPSPAGPKGAAEPVSAGAWPTGRAARRVEPSPTSPDRERGELEAPRSDEPEIAGPAQRETRSLRAEPVQAHPPQFDPPVRPQGTSTPAQTPAPVAADPLGAVDRVMEARDARLSAPVQRVSVRLDAPDAPADRVQVELVDRVLRGGVDVADEVLATRLRGDAGALLRALEGRGFESPSVSVSGVAAVPGRGDSASDLLGWAARSDGVPQALRTLLAESAPAGGRGSDDPRSSAQSGRDGREGSRQQEMRQENRREER